MRHEERFSLCILSREEVIAYLDDLRREYPEIEWSIEPPLQIVLRSDHPLGSALAACQAKFPTYVFREKTIAEGVHRALISAKKTLALAESCTGGALAARLVEIAGASYFLLGAIVAYSNAWKEKFLHVAPSTIAQHGAVSAQVVAEMLRGLFGATEADFAIAVSGELGAAAGQIYIGVAKRGERADIGHFPAPIDRLQGIDFAVQMALGALWRRLIHNTPTFS